MVNEVALLLRGAQPGKHSGVAQHIRRGEHLREAIAGRYGVTHVHAWQVKHVRWGLEHGLGDVSDATRYDYWRTARVIAAALNHWPDWAACLHGPWQSPSGQVRPEAHAGGRPAKLAALASRPHR